MTEHATLRAIGLRLARLLDGGAGAVTAVGAVDPVTVIAVTSAVLPVDGPPARRRAVRLPKSATAAAVTVRRRADCDPRRVASTPARLHASSRSVDRKRSRSPGGSPGGGGRTDVGEPRADWTATQTAEWLGTAFGAAYVGYRKAAVDNLLDGASLSMIANAPTTEAALHLLSEGGIANALHRMQILKRLQNALRDSRRG